VKIRFITRDECPLCDEARLMLDGLARRFALEIEELNVDDDREMLDRYGDSVPVALSAKGKVLASGKWTKSRLIGNLTRALLTRG
jgi:thiol-disulfide isomerase/thioredoxin